jgi:ferrous iron transport protein A
MAIKHPVKKINPQSHQQSHLPLTLLPLSTRAKITSIDSNDGTWERLHEVGLHIDDCIAVIRHAPLDGPLLVECNGHEIAIGRSVAERIFAQVVA